ncbi:MAG: hypothetical protein R2911_22080 [Caldilineaceae bacterium]
MRQAIAAGDLGELTLGVVTMPYSRDAAYYAQAEMARHLGAGWRRRAS